MTAEQTPMDPISGLPLLIVPEDRALFILQGQEANVDPETGWILADWNHAFHPARVVLGDGFGSDAVRNARMQFVMRATHNEYHSRYGGPRLPQNPSERFKTAVLTAAGYIPMQALSLGAESPSIVDLTMMQRERLRTSGEVRVASFSVVQKFLKEFVLLQPVDHIRPNVIDDFLSIDPGESPDDAKRKRYLAHLLLSLVIDRVEDPLEQPYTFAHTYSLLKPGLPRRPGDFVHSVIARGGKSSRGVVRELAKKFSVYRDGPEAVPRLGQLAIAS